MRTIHRTVTVKQGQKPQRSLWQKTVYYHGQAGWVIHNTDGYWGGPVFDEEWYPTLDRQLPNGITVSQVAVFKTRKAAKDAWESTWGSWRPELTIVHTHTITSQ